MAKKKKKRSDKGARIAAILIGVFLLLWVAADVFLNVFGKVTSARDITASRTKWSRQDEARDGKNWRYNVSYIYTVDGVDYDGIDTGVRGEWLGPQYDGTVHYLPFAPRISSMYAEDAVSKGMLLPVGFALALILFAAVPQKRGKGKAFGKKKSAGIIQPDSKRVTMAWLMEHTDGYDDTLEAYYQNGWNKGDPSWQCSCCKWNRENFCESCGKRRQT